MYIIIKVILAGIILFLMNEGARAETSYTENSLNTASSNSIPTTQHLKFPKKTEKYTFIITAHHASTTEAHEALDKKGFLSARFKLSRSLHNNDLEGIDSDASNEHMQANMVIQLDTVPTIEDYLHFFKHPGLLTLDY